MCLLSSGTSLPTPLLGQGTPVGISIPVGPVLTLAQGETGVCARPAGLCWKALFLLSPDRTTASSFHHNYRNIDSFFKSFGLAATFSVFSLRKSNLSFVSSAATHTGNLPLWNVYILVTAQKALKHLQ